MEPNPVTPPPFANYDNAQLEALLHKPGLGPAEKERARAELTRRLRDDLLKTAQNVSDSKRRHQRRGRVRKVGRRILLLLLVLLCALSALCLYILAPEWFARLAEFIQPLLNLLPG